MSKADRASQFLLRILGFAAILVALLWGLNSFLQPIWFYENNYHTYRSFYEEPRDHIETVFVGASMTLFGFSPMEMYEQDGICAYNLASTSQPPMMSYYWVREAYQYHGNTLDTVVMDVSMLRRDSTEADLRKALDGMHSGTVKDEAISEIADGPVEWLTYRFPILGYHDRWSSITFEDFAKYDSDVEDYARGYFMEFSKIFDTYDPNDIAIPAQVIDPTVEPSGFKKQSLYYFNKLLEFCQERDIRLVLVKTPSPSNWSSADHNGVQQIADAYGLDFLDLEIEPVISEIGYSVPLDSKDNDKHLNYYGAMKLSRYMSTYLSETCGNRDVRGVESYEYLDDQLECYHKKVTKLAEALDEQDVAAYLTDIAEADNYTAFIVVRDEATRYMTVDQRLAFAELGLDGLANLQFHDSYIGIMTDGVVEYEQIDHVPTEFEKEVTKIQEDLGQQEALELEAVELDAEEQALADDAEAQDDLDQQIDLSAIEDGEWEEGDDTVSISYKGQLADGAAYVLQSGGWTAGNIASCTIRGTERASNTRGINIVVYDNDSHRVVDSAVFDLYVSSERENPNHSEALVEELEAGVKYSKLPSTLQKLYRYNRRYEYSLQSKQLRIELGEDGLYQYLKSYVDRDGLVVFVCLRGNAVGQMSTEQCEALASVGLTAVPELDENAAYCAVIKGGKLIADATADGHSTATIEGDYYTLSSTGNLSSSAMASVLIEVSGTSNEYATNGWGFNVVVYNPKLGIVVDQACFDTLRNGVSID